MYPRHDEFLGSTKITALRKVAILRGPKNILPHLYGFRAKATVCLSEGGELWKRSCRRLGTSEAFLYEVRRIDHVQLAACRVVPAMASLVPRPLSLIKNERGIN